MSAEEELEKIISKLQNIIDCNKDDNTEEIWYEWEKPLFKAIMFIEKSIKLMKE